MKANSVNPDQVDHGMSTTYAIVDIETTGGNARGSKITEIAIVLHDGRNVTHRWTSLVNPEQAIPPAIFALTGITNEMVAQAPMFVAIAAQVYDLLRGRIFVAHNVNFDYTFIRHQLSEAGFTWSAPKLCTVRMARKIRPGFNSYSLGKLCNTLSIPISDRHRAGGDADATAILFSRLLAWDQDGVIPKMLSKISSDQRLPPNLPKEAYDRLPEGPGVYYFHDRTGKVIYVGKAVNIKKRVSTHFTGHNISPQRQYFLRELYDISHELCGTELMALLLECTEIKRLWPAYNRALKKFEARYGLYTYLGQNGYEYICVGRLMKHQPCIEVFHNELDGINTLQRLVEAFQIDRRLCRFGQAQISQPLQANSDPLPDRDAHNNVVAAAFAARQEQQACYFVLDAGRHSAEQSCIWVERGQFYGMGYLDRSEPVTDPIEIRDQLKRYPSNHYVMQLVNAYIQKNDKKVSYFTQDPKSE